MRMKHVVTCFLEYREKVLILKRSNLVGTYKGKWAGISGYIEKSTTPYRQALTEIKEETNLNVRDIKLIKKGRLIKAKDKKVERVWVIHPFRFYVKTPSKIKIDWEHIKIKWIRPEKIKEYSTVPKLMETWNRLITPLELKIEAIRNDTVHGANHLILMAVDILKMAIKEKIPLESIEEKLIKAKKSILPIENIVKNTFLNQRSYCRLLSIEKNIKKSTIGISNNLLKIMNKEERILTCSYSSTVCKVLKKLAQKINISVFVLESSYGKATYTELRKRNIKCMLIENQYINQYTTKLTKMIVGADAVVKDGVINGVPTLSLALMLKKFIPIYIITSSIKIDTKKTHKNITLSNGFEFIPFSAITGVVTERGIFSI